MSTRKTSHVAGEMTVSWRVELPEEDRYNGQACEDPAIEAALCSIKEGSSIYLWGESRDPAEVTLEVHEADVTIEEDDR
jgi:hypothetical protein